ncbi:hypothetical protein AB2I33_23585 (plasmid) [Escherichia coli]
MSRKSTQLKIRLRKLKYTPYTNRDIPTRKKCRRVDAAINGKYTLKIIPHEIREMIIERECLKLELKKWHCSKIKNILQLRLKWPRTFAE